jgi:hypothetical protein
LLHWWGRRWLTSAPLPAGQSLRACVRHWPCMIPGLAVEGAGWWVTLHTPRMRMPCSSFLFLSPSQLKPSVIAGTSLLRVAVGSLAAGGGGSGASGAFVQGGGERTVDARTLTLLRWESESEGGGGFGQGRQGTAHRAQGGAHRLRGGSVRRMGWPAAAHSLPYLCGFCQWALTRCGSHLCACSSWVLQGLWQGLCLCRVCGRVCASAVGAL